MVLRPPRAKRPDTLVPYTTLCLARPSRPASCPSPSLSKYHVPEQRKRRISPWMPMTAASYGARNWRTEEHTSELQSLMRILYAVSRLTITYHHRHTHKTLSPTHRYTLTYTDV